MQKSQLDGRKFRRQHSINNFIVDFYCPSEKLVVELDGADHYTAVGFEADQERDKILAELGFKVLRFENVEVFKNLGGVLSEISKMFSFPPSKEGIKGG